MFGWLFNKCEHDFKIIDTTFDNYVDDYGVLRSWKRYVLYCPKCDKEKRIDAKRYDLEQNKRDIKAKYNR